MGLFFIARPTQESVVKQDLHDDLLIASVRVEISV